MFENPWEKEPFTCATNIVSKGFPTSFNCTSYKKYDFDRIDNIAENNSNINAEFYQSNYIIPYKPDCLTLHNKPISYLKQFQPESSKQATDIKSDSGTIKNIPLLNGSDSIPSANRLTFVPIQSSGFGVFKFSENLQLPPERNQKVTNERGVNQIGWKHNASNDQAKLINELLENINSQ